MLISSDPISGTPISGQPGVAPASIHFVDVITTQILQLPINCVVAGNQEEPPFRRQVDYRDPNYNTKTALMGSQPRKLSGDVGFKTRTDNKGYD